ncbi:MAG: redox-regulated ATPase YchF [Firmicutes bacterium]|nr:redox-regulated ATPase YchF [Bacillota bacterium]
MFSLGIVGLPNAGKSTLFNALTTGNAAVASFPFSTVEPNVGIVEMPDEPLERLAALLKPEKVTPATVKFVDIAGLVRGASRGEGLGNRFLAHIREVDALAHVVRCFADPGVSHIEGVPNPLRDIGVVETELAIADLETVEKRLEKASREAKAGSPTPKREMAHLDALKARLETGVPASNAPPGSDEEENLRAQLFLLTEKPVIYVANIDDRNLGEEPADVASVNSFAGERGSMAVTVCARLEEELAQLGPEQARLFREELGIRESGLEKLIRASRRALRLISFYTVKGPETRAWLVPEGTKAPQAAGKIHSDMEKGFVRAEVVNYRQLLDAGSFGASRAVGATRSEGRDYLVRGGDVILFKFAPTGS